MRCGYIFPGQGSQQVGMGKDIWKHWQVARQTFAEANDVLSFDLAGLCFTGPQAQLTQTEYAQPAILTVSIAILRILQEMEVVPEMVAGHSVGTFAALVAAGCLPFADALRIVRKRGMLMASVQQHGSMLAVVSSSEAKLLEIEKVAWRDFALDIAAYNSPGQTVFSGTVEVIQQFQQALEGISGVQARTFAVSHAFHSRLMEEQKPAWESFLAGYQLASARIPLGLNVSGIYTTKAALIRKDLEEQFTAPVQWRTLFHSLLDLPCDMLLEVGMGRTLAGLARAWPTKPMVYNTENAMALARISGQLRSVAPAA